MNANRQSLFDNLAAARAMLGCSSWGNFYHRPPISLSFLFGEGYEATPGDIGDAAIHASPIPVHHVLDVQGFKDYDLILVYQLAAEFVSKINTPVRGALFNMIDAASKLFAPSRPLGRFIPLRPGLFQRLFLLLEEARVENVLTSRKRSKMGQSHINANHIRAFWQWFWFSLTGKAGIPFAKSVSFDDQGLRRAFERSVQDNLDIADFR